MKIRGFLLILSLLFICYLGKNYREGLQSEIEKNDVFNKETKYARHTKRQKGCLSKILNDNKKHHRRPHRGPHRGPHRRPHRKPNYRPKHHNSCSNNHDDKHYKCRHLLPKHKPEDSDKYFFNKQNYMLKTKMVPPVSPKGPYIKVVNKDNKRHHGGKHHGGNRIVNDCSSCNNAPNNTFANMNHVPPPLTSNVLPPLSAPASKYEPRPRLTSFAAFGR